MEPCKLLQEMFANGGFSQELTEMAFFLPFCSVSACLMDGFRIDKSDGCFNNMGGLFEMLCIIHCHIL